MRFMMLMIPGVYTDNKKLDENFAPPSDALERMGKFNEELAKAGALISLNGLHPLTKGARVTFAGGRPAVTDGPYVEAKEVLGGYWLLEADSKEQVLEWAKRVPAEEGDIIEVRQIFEMEDFPEDARAATDNQAVRAAVQ